MDALENAANSSQDSTTRLGQCEVCGAREAKYTCPRCEVKTCCLNCVRIHKKELECNGLRDKTKYVPLKKMTRRDFLNDYNFLEECTHYVANRKKDKVKRLTRHDKQLPIALYKLRAAAHKRNTTLHYMLPHFTRRRINSTMYHWSTDTIFWRVEWIFPNAADGCVKAVDERCCEDETIASLLEKYFSPQGNVEPVLKKTLEFYQSIGIGTCKVLLKSEGIRKCHNRFFVLDIRTKLRECLAKKTIVEYPVIYVIFPEAMDYFEVVDEDDIAEEEQMANPIEDSPAKEVCRDLSHLKLKSGPNSIKNFLFADEEDELSSPSETD